MVRIRHDGEEVVRIFVGRTQIAYANYEEHGWAAMKLLAESIKALAFALKVEVKETY